jgi:hypothetical protein
VLVIVISHDDHGQKEFVPRDDKLPDSHKNDGGFNQRNSNVTEHLRSHAAVDHGRLEQEKKGAVSTDIELTIELGNQDCGCTQVFCQRGKS